MLGQVLGDRGVDKVRHTDLIFRILVYIHDPSRETGLQGGKKSRVVVSASMDSWGGSAGGSVKPEPVTSVRSDGVSRKRVPAGRSVTKFTTPQLASSRRLTAGNGTHRTSASVCVENLNHCISLPEILCRCRSQRRKVF